MMYRAEQPDAVDRAGILVLRGLKSLQPARQLIRNVRRRRFTEMFRESQAAGIRRRSVWLAAFLVVAAVLGFVVWTIVAGQNAESREFEARQRGQRQQVLTKAAIFLETVAARESDPVAKAEAEKLAKQLSQMGLDPNAMPRE